MAHPLWITPVGSLGTIAQGVFTAIIIEAIDPVSVDTVFYRLIAGQLPGGIAINENGLLSGIPNSEIKVGGVPYPVIEDTTSKFVIRAFTTNNNQFSGTVKAIADRTFELTVIGIGPPVFTTPAGQIAELYDGSLVNYLQIQYSNTIPNELINFRVISGSLPPGLTISRTGVISGVIPNINNDTNYHFTLEISNGKVNGTNVRSFSIQVWATGTMSADDTDLTADSDYTNQPTLETPNFIVTSDVSNLYTPVITTPQGSIGNVTGDNYFAFQFQGIDFNGDPITFVKTGDVAGLTLDPNSGWLYGYLPEIGIGKTVYDFSIQVYKNFNPLYISPLYNFSLTVQGALNSQFEWITESDLGTINNGSISTLYVLAVSNADIPLQYRLESGSDSSLPQGLQLLPSGHIAGRVSFDTFSLDLGKTRFDVSSRTKETTFDMKHTFVVNAYSVNGLINATKTFSITVKREYNEPYDNLYIQAMPPENDRALIQSLLQNTDIFQPGLLYRADDPNFGRAQGIVYQHAFGLTSATYADYINSLYENHYWKNLILGEIEVAQARNANNEVIYEVVYSRVIDNLLNDQGQSVSKQVTLPYPIDGTKIVYPNSLINMRDQVIDTVGEVSDILPLWMTSKQPNGKVLGFTPACVLAYAKPGKGDQLAYYIKTKFGQRLNLVDFEVDRYELDRLLSKNWDPVANNNNGAWEPPAAETTFDIDPHYQITSIYGGIGYRGTETDSNGNIIYPGDEIIIYGSQVGGTNELNNISIRVTTVNTSGAIQHAFCQGTAPLFTVGDVYNSIAGTNVTGTGSGATWNFVVGSEDQTVFDYNSLRFIAPVDMYSNTQEYDKYLVFPHRTILG